VVFFAAVAGTTEGLQVNDFAVDQENYWTEEDKTDILSFSWQYATSSFTEDKAV
jgi:hypothetical protein